MIMGVDAPWCTITSTAASHKHLAPKGHPLEGIEKTKVFKEDEKLGVKGRNEPGDVSRIAIYVAEVSSLISSLVDRVGGVCGGSSKGRFGRGAG